MASPSSLSSPRNWVYDVFPSFRGEDVRKTFLSHFLKELDRKLIIAFKDNEIERSHSLDPELKQAIRTSRIAVVVFSEKYPSSSWCLDELLEIVNCKEESGQIIIPVFYGLDPSHVRKQTGKFGQAFAKTCLRKTEDETKLWQQSLIDVANVLGYRIDRIYEVCLPSEDLALIMFSRSAFRQNSPPAALMEIASHIALRTGNLPLGLKVLGSYLRGSEKEDWINMMPSLRTRLNGKIERTLRLSYDGLNNKKDEAIFRHVACLFNGEKVNEIKMLLVDSDLDVNIGLRNIVEKSLVHVRNNIVEMHSLLQDMGKEVVRAQSDEPGE